MSTIGKSALLLGATGATGQYLLKNLLASQYWTRVGEYGRRVTDLDSLEGTEKLEQKIIDFENLGQSGLKDGNWDVVFIVLGTTKKIAGSAENFQRIDRDLGYVINAAREAKSPEVEQRLVYLSVMGAGPSALLPYFRSKGETEYGLAELGYHETIVFRVGFLVGVKRPQMRLSESVSSWFLMGPLSSVSQWIQIKVPPLAKAIAAGSQLGVAALPDSANAFKDGPAGHQYTVVSNSGCLALAEL
ncbi:hypothetical protein C8J56DRAFT_1006703 [Mycena floridula]|nr:hypothetical protein C8J56DRAFT_1006703 [Mycena floridula]